MFVVSGQVGYGWTVRIELLYLCQHKEFEAEDRGGKIKTVGNGHVGGGDVVFVIRDDHLTHSFRKTRVWFRGFRSRLRARCFPGLTFI